MFVCSELEVGITSPVVSEIAKVLPEAIYCCFTRTTLFTTMFTIIIVVCLLCIPSFVLIVCCISELHGHLCPYCNVLPEAVYVVLQE